MAAVTFFDDFEGGVSKWTTPFVTRSAPSIASTSSASGAAAASSIGAGSWHDV